MSNNSISESYRAIEYLHQMAENGQLIVGSKIPPEREMAQIIGISRNSTREAISILRGIGIIESRQGSGNYVSKDPSSSISMMIKAMLALRTISTKDIIEFRRITGHAVCDMICDRGLSDQEVAEFQEILDGMMSSSKEKSSEYDIAFHRKTVSLLDNTLFRIMLDAAGEVCFEHIPRVIECTDEKSRRELVDIHRLLIEGIINKDREMCALYVDKHYSFVEKCLL